MFKLIDRWLSKDASKADENIALINAPRTSMSRRGFITGLVGGVIGISTGIILPSKKIVIAAIQIPNNIDIPNMHIQNYYKFNLARSAWKCVSAPIQERGVNGTEAMKWELTCEK